MDKLENWNDVPRFASMAEERAYWNQTSLDPLLLHQTMVRGDSQEMATLSVKLDPRFLSRLKRHAKSRYSDMPSMIRHWLIERLETESPE